MKTRRQFYTVLAALAVILCLLTACGKKRGAAENAAPTEVAGPGSGEESLGAETGPGATDPGSSGQAASPTAKPETDETKRWAIIMRLWGSQEPVELHYDELPEGLNDTESLCLVVLGFQLNEDGSMKEELYERLKLAKRCAEQYPNALIVCTGGPTARDDPEATEAGNMAQWLVENGVDAARILIEDRSLTTEQNAIYTFDLLVTRCPQVRELAILSSDYHIPRGTLLFEAEATFRAEKTGQPKLSIIGNACCHPPKAETEIQGGDL